jgi:hypothetical protein
MPARPTITGYEPTTPVALAVILKSSVSPHRGHRGDASFEHFDSEVVYLSKAGQQAHPAVIFKEGPIDEVDTLKAGPRRAASHGDLSPDSKQTALSESVFAPAVSVVRPHARADAVSD